MFIERRKVARLQLDALAMARSPNDERYSFRWEWRIDRNVGCGGNRGGIIARNNWCGEVSIATTMPISINIYSTSLPDVYTERSVAIAENVVYVIYLITLISSVYILNLQSSNNTFYSTQTRTAHDNHWEKLPLRWRPFEKLDWQRRFNARSITHTQLFYLYCLHH